MATYLPQITDTNLQTPLFSPNYEFLQANMQKKETQYLKGLSEVSAGYQAIVNAKVSDYANVQKKQEYIKAADEGLKKISASDLSVPTNSTQAQNLYAPFWQDDILLKDIGLTSKIQNNKQKALAVQNSTDEKVRSTFDPRYIELLGYQQNRLANAGRNSEEYSNLEVDDWIPFHKVDQYLRDTRDKDKFAVTHDIVDNNGRILTVTNGTTSVPAFRTYADGNVGTEFNAQYNMLGKLDRERQVYQYQQIHPEATRKQALEQIVTGGEHSLYNQVVDSYKSRIGDHAHMQVTTQADIDAINALVNTQPGKKPTELQAYNLQRLTGELEKVKTSKANIEKTYADLISEDGKLNMINHPELMLGQMYRTQDIDKWAQGQAENATYKVSKDDAFWTNKTLQKEYAQLGEQHRHNQEIERTGNRNAATSEFNAETSRMDVQGKYPWIFTGMGSPLGGRPGGEASDQLFQMSAIEEANLKAGQLVSDIYNRTYNPGGLSSALSEIPKEIASSDDVLRYTKYMNDYYNKIENKDPATIASYNKVAGFLGKETGLPVTNQDEANSALMAYIPKYLDKHIQNGSLNTTESKQISDMYKGIKSDINTVEKDNRERKEAIKVEIDKHPKKYEKVVAGDRLINDRDVAKTIAESGLEYVVVRDERGIAKKISIDEIAGEYLKGNNVIDNKHNLSINGASYPIVSVMAKGTEKSFPDHWYQSENARAQVAGNEVFSYLYGRNKYGQLTGEPMNSVMSKYGKPAEVRKLMNAAQNAIVPKTSIYNNLTGVIGNKTIIPHDDDKSPGTLALREDVLPGQFNSMYNLQDRSALSGEDQRNVQDIINDPKLINWIGQEHWYVDMSHTGKPGTIVTFRAPISGEEVPSNVKSLLGKRIFIEQSNTHGAYWNKTYPKAVDYSSHPLSKPGGEVSSDGIENATNMGSYKITNSQGQAVITGQITIKDPLTGKDSVRTIYKPVPLSEQNPEKIETEVQQLWLQNGDNYRKAFDYYRLNHNK